MISRRAASISPSPTLAITAKAKEMAAKGIDVVPFAAGEPDFDTPDHIKHAAMEAIREGFTKYTATGGIPELKEAICGKFRVDNGLEYYPENILVSNGAKQCLYNLLHVLLEHEDEVLIPMPFWVSFDEMVKLAGGKSVFLKSDDFKIAPEAFRKNISQKSKILILNSPSNPAGTVYSKEELAAIAEICVEKNIRVISDEIYEKIVYEKQHHSIASINPEIKKLTCVVNGVSKTYAMTGWRIGYCAGEKNIIKAASSLQDHSTSNPNSIAQRAALAALTGPHDSIRRMVDEYRKRRDYMLNRLSHIGGIEARKPDGAFYIFADVSGLYSKKMRGSVEFCDKLLEKAHVAAIPGIAFGDDNHVRLSYATSMENIGKGMDRLERFAQSVSTAA